MKKILLGAVLLFACNAVNAQEKGDVEFGFTMGYTGAAVATDNFVTEGRSGLLVGASADYYFSDRWSIKGRLIYDPKGWTEGIITNPTTGQDVKTDYHLNYLTVPVMANWHFGSKRNWYLNFGPYAGFLLNAEETTFGTDVKEAFNSTDFGLALGVGVKIPLTDKLKLSIDYDEQYGLSNIFSGSDAPDAINTRGSFSLGVTFMMK